jgi:hypothetical protein
VKLRGHNLLCIQGFVGKGYSDEFVANMTGVIGSLDEASQVTVVVEPDALCGACPHLRHSGCALHGAGSEEGIRSQDRGVLGRLGISNGETLSWGEILERIRGRVAPGDLDTLCGSCPWLPMSHCKAGLRHLNAAP